MNSSRVIVVGGGITGLSCAHRLMSLGVDVVLLEPRPRPGGRIETVADAGVQFEAGPNTLLANAAPTLALIEEAGLSDEVVDAAPEAKRRWVLQRGRMVPLPAGPLGALTSPLLGLRGVLGAAGDLWRRGRPPEPDESVASFITRRFGRRVLENLVGPFLTGVHAGDTDRLEARSVLRALVDAEERHGSVILGALAARRAAKREGRTPPPMRTITFRGGLESLPQRLAMLLGERLRLGLRAEAIERTQGGCTVLLSDGERLDAARVVIATDAAAAAALIAPLPGAQHAADALRAVETAGLAVLGLLYPRARIAHALDGFGFLAGPGWEGRTLGCIFRSTIFPHAAPPGTALLTAFVGGARDTSWMHKPDETLVHDTHEELKPLLGLGAPPRRVFLRRWPRAIPQLNRGHHRAMQYVSQWSDGEPVRILCNAQSGLSLGACIAAGRAEAERIAAERGQAANPGREAPEGRACLSA